jgi:hypothetical protein
VNARQRRALANPLTGDIRHDDALIRAAQVVDSKHLRWHEVLSIVAVDR